MISEFTDEYFFLSNFYSAPIFYDNRLYANNEAAFQSQKCALYSDRDQFCNLNPSEAKKLGRHVKLRADWEDAKFDTMYDICLKKFEQNVELAIKLLQTDDEILIEGNTWGDMIWGQVNGQGENHLGIILMEVRDNLRKYVFQLKKQCVKSIRDFFRMNGPACDAIIGISGGKDSTVAAALCAEALGPDRVIGVLMPNDTQSDIQDSYEVCDYLKIKHHTVNIGSTTYSLRTELQNAGIVESEQCRINLPPRIRMSTLYAVAQCCNGRVINTCNKSEEFIGYFTRWGDSVGDFKPLVNLTSSDVQLLGYACNLPTNLVLKTPSDGLCGKSDEDNFGFSYHDLNMYIENGTCGKESIDKRIYDMHMKSEFKRSAVPEFVFWCLQ